MLVQLRPVEALVAREAAAQHVVDRDDARAAARGDRAAACPTVPILRTLHTGWIATGRGAGARGRDARQHACRG